jgi:hypothetical protein
MLSKSKYSSNTSFLYANVPQSEFTTLQIASKNVKLWLKIDIKINIQYVEKWRYVTNTTKYFKYWGGNNLTIHCGRD